jgi:argonaute-like protein implicated in RNA metabolism and viral defense
MPTFLTGNRVEREPNLLFDKSDSSAIHPQVYWGLRRYGPYDKDKISSIRLGIISPLSRVDQVRKLIDELNKGTPIMPGGMPKFFGCHIDVVSEELLDSIELSSYEKGCANFVKRFEPKEVDAVLVYIPKTNRYFSNTPYYRSKAILTSEGYASQMITDFIFPNLKWSYLNLASAIYSKAGGIPWVLESEMKNVDILLGISISNLVSEKYRAGMSARYVGYVNVFDSYGKWMFYEGTAESYEKGKNYEQLKELLSKAFQKFEAEKRFQPKNIIIHYYKKWGMKEMESVIRILHNLLGDFCVGFISIDDSHPFRLYDTSVADGSFPRGYYIYLTENAILMSTTGFTTIATRRMGTPKLLHIVSKKQYPSDFIKMDDLASQILSLTKLDWATATPLIREPITLQFSREIAYLTAAISEQEWKLITRPEVNVMLSRRPWFI